MLEAEVFSPIDHQTAQFLSKALLSDDEDLLLFLCYLASSFRQGCLFVACFGEALTPPAEDAAMHDAIVRGFKKLQETKGCPYIILQDEKVFFDGAFALIVELARLSQKLVNSEANLVVDKVKLRISLDALLQQNILLPEQAAAIQESAQKSLSCIWGGPGTGKTYTAGWLVKLFLEQHPTARIVLAAPTGKAAANLLESIQRAVGPKAAAALQAKTLHALLSLRRASKAQSRPPLGYDLVIVDESSMIDASMCVKLLSALPDSSRIIFLGDPFQLPPIEPGEPFVAFVEQKKATQSPGELITTKRQENKAIIDLAECVKTGAAERALQVLLQDATGVLQFCSLESHGFNPEEFVKQLYISQEGTVEAFFNSMLQTRILCPQRVGPYGTVAMNSRMLQSAQKIKHTDFQPIIITKNDYALGLTNGQVGVISGSSAYFESFEETKALRRIPQVLLASFEPAYCLSVHKSQGSEFGHVILLLPSGSERFGRKMLYTAITRAKKSLTIYSTPSILKECILNEGRPVTTFFGLSSNAQSR